MFNILPLMEFIWFICVWGGGGGFVHFNSIVNSSWLCFKNNINYAPDSRDYISLHSPDLLSSSHEHYFIFPISVSNIAFLYCFGWIPTGHCLHVGLLQHVKRVR